MPRGSPGWMRHRGMQRLVAVLLLLVPRLMAFRMPGLESDIAPAMQVEAVQGLISRLLGSPNVAAFVLHIEKLKSEERYFDLRAVHTSLEIADSETNLPHAVVEIVADSGVSLASGLYSYLKEDMHFIVTWGEGGSGDNLPPSEDRQAWYTGWLPPKPRRVISNSQVQYYENVCTFGYSQTWWDWKRWEREIDWMALHGVNLPLAFVGQEKLWLELFTTVGALDRQDVLSWMSGPAFLPWFRMGNMESFGGRLPPLWLEGQDDLQLQILRRMRALGMIPVLAGFAGFVPDAFAAKHPNANVTKTNGWGGFPAVSMLEPTDPMFVKLGTALASIQEKAYGFLPKVVNADTYNEMDPRSGNLDYLKLAGAAPYEGIKAANPEGILMIQGWLFYSSERFWTEPRIEAYLSGVPSSKMIILDLYSDVYPQWQRTKSYYGRPWIWNMLLNFGGQRQLQGNIANVGSAPLAALDDPNVTCIGTGMTPEAIENNPVMFEVITEISWRHTAIDPDVWLPQYVKRRYGEQPQGYVEAWRKLHEAVYNNTRRSESIIRAYPEISLNPQSENNFTLLVEAARQLVEAAQGAGHVNGPLEYDLVDVVRQVLDFYVYDIYKMYRSIFETSDIDLHSKALELNSVGKTMLNLIVDEDSLLAANQNYLLGTWLAGAHWWSGPSPETVQLFLFNAINQVTRWGFTPRGNINDYASKAWAGLTRDYYFRRWQLFLRSIQASVEHNATFNTTAYEMEQDQWQVAYNEEVANESRTYATNATGSTLHEAARVLTTYAGTELLHMHFDAVPDQDHSGDDIFQAATRDLAQLASLCLANPGCTAFNSNGFIKRQSEPRGKSPHATLFLRRKQRVAVSAVPTLPLVARLHSDAELDSKNMLAT